MAAVISPPDARGVVAPLLPSLPGAALSAQPSTAVLPLLSPILRQRVQFLSASSTEPWIRLLSYDTAKGAKLLEIARSARLEPHPVSGEIEVDWDIDVEIRYKRPDKETLQALVLLRDLDLVFRLVYCPGDQEGGSGGWRVGEVSIPDQPSAFSSFGGYSSIAEAEKAFEEGKSASTTNGPDTTAVNGSRSHLAVHDAEDADDDDYWARYDATPARTPAAKRSPAPGSLQPSQVNTHRGSSAEDAYYAQYDTVQPAMDNDDPDEVMAGTEVSPPLGLARASARGSEGTEDPEPNETRGAWTLAEPPEQSPTEEEEDDDEERLASILHPRPASASSHSSNASLAVAKLEESAEKQEQSEFGVKQHVSRSIKSLFLLSRASGIERDEFERMVKTELDLLGMMED